VLYGVSDGLKDPKGDGTPRGAVSLPFLAHNRTPVRSISARVVAQRLPMKVLAVEKQHPCQTSQFINKQPLAVP
jgi:hypothetical protein